MPLFDYRCSTCERLERDYVRGPDDPHPICCGAAMETVWLRPPAARLFRAGFYEHVAAEPMYFDSREKLKSFVKENGMYMEAVDGH